MEFGFMQAADLRARLEPRNQAGSEVDLILALEAARDLDPSTPDLVLSIALFLRETSSQRVRDAAAITLADLKDPRGAEALVEVLRRPEIAVAAGTLLYALDEIGATLPLDILASIVLHGSYEARAMALRLLEDGRIGSIERTAEAAVRRSFAALAASDDLDGAEAARAALDGLDDLDRTSF